MVSIPPLSIGESFMRCVTPLIFIVTALILISCSGDSGSFITHNAKDTNLPVVTYGVRPFYLIDDMDESPLKEELKRCKGQTPKRTNFSISHRGAPLQFPEHTMDSYKAGLRMGAGIIECDVTFTKDKKLVCRHAQNDLHRTTNILKTKLANKCRTPPLFNTKGELVNAKDIECRTSDITLAEFKTLKGKMDGRNIKAKNIDDYMNATANWRTDLYSQNSQLVTLEEHIKLIQKHNIKHSPELKVPIEDLPFDGYTLNDFRLELLNSYKRHAVQASDFYPQTLDYKTIKFWLKNEPTLAKNATYIISKNTETLEGKEFDKDNPSTWKRDPKEIHADGVNVVSVASYLLVSIDKNGRMVPSEYAKRAKDAGLKIIAWTVERSTPLANGGGYYYTGLKEVINNDGDVMNYIDVLAQDVGVIGIFSDWPATVTYYANCKGL